MNNFKDTTKMQYDIFPTPQEMTYLAGQSKMTDHVNVIVSAELKAATLPLLLDTLTTHGFTYTVSEQEVPSQSNIYLCNEQSSELQAMAAAHPELATMLNRTEGYRLLIYAGRVTIVGHDREGIHYGVVTLRSILQQSSGHVLQNCAITDYPEILYRGYIEGFYGYPWSHEDRIDLMRFGGEQKLNTYIYAPKDDPYHRKDWRELYPADKAREIAELAAAGHQTNMNFVWTIHPGDSIDLSSEEDAKSVIVKLEQLYSLGVRQFGILFDDLVGVPNGVEQAQFINRIDAEFIKAKGDIRPLITVGTRYCEAWGPSMQQYFKPFVDTLHEDVEVMWTGAATMSNIAKEQFEAPRREIHSTKQLSVWWNYPVNDYCDAKLLMGKIRNLSSDLDNVNGFFANPMNQSQASKQALFCIADHNWNTDAYDTDKSYSASFKALAPEVAEDLEIFASNCCYVRDNGGASGEFLFDESWYLKDDIAALTDAMKQGHDVAACADQLQAHFVRMETAADHIEQQCTNQNLLRELAPFLKAFRLMAQAAQRVIHAVHAQRAGDLAAMDMNNEAAFELLTLMQECKVRRLKEEAPHDFTVDVGTLVMIPFISDMIVQTAVAAGTEQALVVPSYEMKNIALQSLGVTATASQSISKDQDADQVISGKISSGKWCSSDHRPYLTVDLQQPVTVKQYRIVNCGHPEASESWMWSTKHVQILASMDGENFSIVDEVADNQDDVINRILYDEVTARYFRLQVMEPSQMSMNGGGHTRIYAFELFDDAYPDHSAKVLTSDMVISASGDVTIRNVKKGDVVSLFHTLDDQIPYATTEVEEDHMNEVTIEGAALRANNGRIFVERTSRHYLPSVRTSKSIAR
ncbi:beta-N-acetylglucosaminidase domain-containing protein [Paenibacillus marinisediminis]